MVNNFKNNKTFWDIGANIGIYSIYAATKFTKLKIIAFEPSTSNTRTLSRNISINNFDNKIKIFPIALCNKPNILSFRIDFMKVGQDLLLIIILMLMEKNY